MAEKKEKEENIVATGGKLPKATHQGTIKIGNTGVEIPCAVLDNGTRILRERSVAKALQRKGAGSHWKRKKDLEKGALLPEYVSVKNIQDFIDDDIRNKLLNPITYLTKTGNEASGIEATLLSEICNIWLKARENGALSVAQEKTAKQAEMLMRGFAHVGIIALIDEATGYQDVRMKKALEEILNKYLLSEAKKYSVTYPLELYKEWFKLNNWEWKPENAQKRPSVLGTWTNKYIYERMAPNLLKNLENRNPKTDKGYRKHKHFQFLTDEVGEPKLREFFGGHLALARATTTWRKYTALVEKAYPSIGDQMTMDLDDD
jgi:hypothetical protein